jgi:hypothetical protein
MCLLDIYQCFLRICCLHLQDTIFFCTEDGAARSSNKMVNIIQTTGRHIPEDRSIQSQRRERLRSYKITSEMISNMVKYLHKNIYQSPIQA